MSGSHICKEESEPCEIHKQKGSRRDAVIKLPCFGTRTALASRPRGTALDASSLRFRGLRSPHPHSDPSTFQQRPSLCFEGFRRPAPPAGLPQVCCSVIKVPVRLGFWGKLCSRMGAASYETVMAKGTDREAVAERASALGSESECGS
ncbi:hypothetical protein H920_17052 [Fukomys damarensis]|uniref:Uncharacterized protein n=1 Tax=Fukomys damarensis TaxID=885580 RepID=A0A091CT92_FUKDA|nr:hypothetical protein H920_17052 [Fukomys damarensis]